MTRVLVTAIGEVAEVELLAAARALRDAGMEVIYAGPSLEPEVVVRIAIQEDVAAIGVVGHAGTLTELLGTHGADDVVVAVLGSEPASLVRNRLRESR